MQYTSATSKSQATSRMYLLGGQPLEGLGPGSKEKKSALLALGKSLGLDLASLPGKVECARRIADELAVAWEPDCFSAGDSITLVGLNRLVDAEVRRKSSEGLLPGSQLEKLIVASAPRAIATKREAAVAQDLSEIRQSVEEHIKSLAEISEMPEGRVAPRVDISYSSVGFDDGQWRSSVAGVQGWLHLGSDLPDEFSAESFDDSLADCLGVDLGPGIAESGSELLLTHLLQRLERAVSLRQAFIDQMERSVEGGATRLTATQDWDAAWEEVDDEDESEIGGSINAEADTWPISQFVQLAADGELNLSPSYQRADVWPTGDAQLLIESVLRGIPLPSIIILQKIDDKRSTYEVVDGKQRLTSILRFTGHHPVALEEVERLSKKWSKPDLLKFFHEDFPEFKRLWKANESASLTTQVARQNYFPFALRAGDVKPLSGQLAGLKGKYYSEIRTSTIEVAGEPRTVRYVFEQAAKYKLPVIVYKQVRTHQVHEVFSLYNRQGKHLNAEEIRNALYHELDLMRALLATAGDSRDHSVVAPFLDDAWTDLSSTARTLNDYGFGIAGYKRTKLLSWVASVLFLDEANPGGRSTSSQINALLKRVDENRQDLLRRPERITEAMLVLDHGLDAHATVPQETWAAKFVNSQSKGRWQELQLVATIIAFAAASAVLGDRLNDAVEERLEILAARSALWKRPAKTQTKEQWQFIALVVRDLMDVLEVDPTEADELLRQRFGGSGLAATVALVGRSVPVASQG